MQKIINVMAIASFAVSGVFVASAGYLYINRDSIIDGVKAKVVSEVTELLPELIGGALGADLAPDLPVTQPSIPSMPF